MSLSWNPIRRSPPKPKPRQHKESAPWRHPKVRLNAREMLELRQNVFARSLTEHGFHQCENSIDSDGTRCPVRITSGTFHLAHIVSRGRGGSDIPENVLACCMDCHFEDTRNRRKLVPWKDWVGKA